MGIYPADAYAIMKDGTLIFTTSAPGITRTVIYEPIVEFEHRTDCYCCSCDVYGASDPYCRNHGFAGERPCDAHGMPGQEDDEGVMPDSVQAHRSRWAT